jgi:hypothetical protein
VKAKYPLPREARIRLTGSGLFHFWGHEALPLGGWCTEGSADPG